jgi:hypothetical protein
LGQVPYPGYFEISESKFRPYKVSKGKKLLLNDDFIENRDFRIDTYGEKKGLSVARFLAQQRKKQISPSSSQSLMLKGGSFD